ncbi:MAG: sigma-70 family RNA polymerase sigma factor [Bacteroidetes bacterium]|nr:sigma-70 family RNA polymerase sigma factor [Bacteroidota bacterium]MBS1630717.1 sigma-70 family RNA polymerase sigma factor [Bacteroidota bacterium]
MLPHTHHNNLSDDELLHRFEHSRDNYWLGLLLQRYTLLLLGLAMKYLRDQSSAQDAVQQVFLKALTRFPKEPMGNVKGWLFILMRNHCFQLLRDADHWVPEPIGVGTVSEPDSIAHFLEKEFLLQELEQALNELGLEQQQCIRAFYLEHQSYQQITDMYGYSFSQVKSFIQNGKRNLKIILSKKVKP